MPPTILREFSLFPTLHNWYKLKSIVMRRLLRARYGDKKECSEKGFMKGVMQERGDGVKSRGEGGGELRGVEGAGWKGVVVLN